MVDEPTDRIPFRIESQRGDDTLGTNAKTGTLITDFQAKETGAEFKSGVPRDKIQEAIEMALKQEKWVCVEKNDGTTELLTQKDIPKAQDLNAITPAAEVKDGELIETTQPSKEEWKGDLKPIQAPPKKQDNTVKPAEKGALKPKEEWVSKFANIKSATATHKGKGG